MPMSKFDRKVCELQNVLIPEAQRVAGHALLPTDRQTITKLIRETLVDPDPRKLDELKKWVTPKTPPLRANLSETAGQVSPMTEQAPTAYPPAPKGLLEERVRAELFQRSEVGRRMLGRGLTLEEQQDLEATIRERFGEAFANTAEVTGRHPFGEAAMEGRFGPAKSPGLARPVLRTAAEISESAAVPGASGRQPGELGRMPMVEGLEAFQAELAAFAATVPFGATRLDDPGR